MQCQVCGNREYTIKITRINKGKAEELKVCEECAAQISPYHAKIHKKASFDKKAVENLLKDLLTQKEASTAQPGPSTERAAPAGPICPSCGLDFRRYKQTYMLGCPDCYDAFGEHLLEDLEKIQHATTHVGGRTTTQNRLLDLQARARALRIELDECVENEDFARAARLRDEIEQLQESVRHSDEDMTES